VANVREVAYLGRDNTISIKLLDNNVPVDLTGVNRVILKLGNAVVDSNATAGVFDWNSSGTDGVLKINLGKTNLPPSNVTVGRYYATLVVYDSLNDDGVVWTEPASRTKFIVTVKSGY